MKEKQPYTPAAAGTVGQQTTEPWATPEQAEPVKEDCMRLISGLKMRTVAGQTLLYPATPEAGKKVYQPAVLNKEATQLVKWMAEDFTVDSIVEKGLNLYLVEKKTLEDDVRRIVDALCAMGMLEGKAVTQILKRATTTLSGTAIIKNGVVNSKSINGIKHFFEKTDK